MRTIAFSLALVWLLAPPASFADTINGCVNQKTGKLRIVGVPGQCKDGREAAISWESEGPQGTPGEKGDKGDQGDAGEPAAAPPRFELIGFTTATFAGGEGVLGYTLA